MTGAKGAAPSEARVYVGAGSNIEPEHHLRAALRQMERRFGTVSKSSVYRTKAVGFDGDDFLNLVVSFRTPLPPADLVAELDRIEASVGRRRHGERFASRTLDLDLLMYADMVVDEPALRLPRDDIMRYGFVLGPLAELAPDLAHPTAGATMHELWERFDEGDQPIGRISPSPI